MFPKEPDDKLPIDEVMGSIKEAATDRGGCVIKAPPGAGKTTRVPPALVESGIVEGEVWVLEPRRLAASSTAKRVAEERGVSTGQKVGYQVRFDHRRSDATLVNYVTEGIFLRKAQTNPLLEGIGAVIIDEFHERSINADLSIGFLKEIAEIRPDMAVMVMSATIDTGPIGQYLDVPTIESEGRLYPVDIDYLSDPPDSREKGVVEGVETILRDEEDSTRGDILAFMPGAGSIHRVVDSLQDRLDSNFDIRPLYGGLAPEKQDKALSDSEDRRVIVSTNIAETSLTIRGVTGVVDSGLVKRVYYDPGAGVDRLETEQISMASAKQRAGRAGRVEPGRAIRVWPKSKDFRMPEREIPAVKRVDLSRAILEVIAWTGASPLAFDWFERPKKNQIRRSVQLLENLGFVVSGDYELTELGELARQVPAHPRIARILIEGRNRGIEWLAAGAGAVLSEREFVMSTDDRRVRSDIWLRLQVLAELFGRGGHQNHHGLDIHFGRAKRVWQVWGQLFDGKQNNDERVSLEKFEPLAKSIMAGYPDRVAIRRGDDRDYVTVQGEPLTLAYESNLEHPEFVVAPRVKGSIQDYGNKSVGDRQLIRLASEVERGWVEETLPELFDEEVVLRFDESRSALSAERIEKFGQLELSSHPEQMARFFDEEHITERLIDEIEGRVVEAFELQDRQKQILYRLRFLAEEFDDFDLPDFVSDSFGQMERQILRQMCWGKSRFSELRTIDFGNRLQQCLRYEQAQLLASEAPAKLRVPAGVERQLDYSANNPPILRARIQELFGMDKSPRVAGGRTKVTVELLAPNFRNVQRTDDLKNFWEHTYPEIRKDYRGQYPKHPWPEDPSETDAVSI